MTQRKMAREFEMTLMNGLLARPAALLVKTASTFDAEISFGCRGVTVNAKSLLGVLSLVVARGDLVSITAHGLDAAQALRAISVLSENGFESAAPTPRSLFAALSR